MSVRDGERKSYLFGSIVHTSVGNISVVTVFGLMIYCRIDSRFSIFGIVGDLPAPRS